MRRSPARWRWSVFTDQQERHRPPRMKQPWDGVAGVEHPTDQQFHPRQRPSLGLIGPSVRERAALQFPFQPFPLPRAQSLGRDRAFGGQRVRSALVPGVPPAAHQPPDHLEQSGDDLGLIAAREVLGRVHRGVSPPPLCVRHEDVVPRWPADVIRYRTSRVQAEHAPFRPFPDTF